MYINMNTGIIEETRDVNNCLGGLWWVGGDALVTGFEHMDTLYPVWASDVEIHIAGSGESFTRGLVQPDNGWNAELWGSTERIQNQESVSKEPNELELFVSICLFLSKAQNTIDEQSVLPGDGPLHRRLAVSAWAQEYRPTCFTFHSDRFETVASWGWMTEQSLDPAHAWMLAFEAVQFRASAAGGCWQL